MKKLIAGIAALIVLVGGVYAVTGCGIGTSAAAQVATPSAQSSEPVKAANKVVSDGRVVPVQHVALSLPTGGTVAEVAVTEGEQVQAGELILRLDVAAQAAAVTQAEAGLKRAEARLDQLKAGSRSQEIEAAKAAVAAAQGQLDRLTQGARPEDLAAAEAALAAATANLAQAEAKLASLRAKPKAEDVRAAELDLERAKNALWATQIERDGYCGWTSGYECDAANARVGAAETAVETAVENLNRAKQPAEAADVKAAEAAVDSAALAVSSAEANLEAIKGPARPADIAAAAAEVRRAQAQLDLLEAGARTEEIAMAEADVEAAKGALEQARAALANAEVRAPFAGTVVSIDAKVGEQVMPGVVVVQIADLSSFLVETTDLTELDISRVREGSLATVSVDGIPDLELPAKVTRIKSIGENRQGDIVYTATITPDRQDERLKWNMTASVSIDID